MPGAAGEVLDLYNGERSANGLAPFSTSGCLTEIAQPWTDRMAGGMGLAHNDLDNLRRCGGSRWAENVAYNVSIPAVHSWWMGSAPHRANILDPNLTHVGIGVTQAADGAIWVTVDFLG